MIYPLLKCEDKDKAFTDALVAKADELEKQAEAKEAAIRAMVAEKM